jgi:hypothetical protein
MFFSGDISSFAIGLFISGSGGHHFPLGPISKNQKSRKSNPPSPLGVVPLRNPGNRLQGTDPFPVLQGPFKPAEGLMKSADQEAGISIGRPLACRQKPEPDPAVIGFDFPGLQEVQVVIAEINHIRHVQAAVDPLDQIESDAVVLPVPAAAGVAIPKMRSSLLRPRYSHRLIR